MKLMLDRYCKDEGDSEGLFRSAVRCRVSNSP